jgi:hypothetical protein
MAPFQPSSPMQRPRSGTRGRSVSPMRHPRDRQHHVASSFGSLPSRYDRSPAQHREVNGSSSALFPPTSPVKRQSMPDHGAGRRHLVSRQKSITISVEQFVQQQQTIASLLGQQQDLKHLVSVLQHQQNQLMNLPMQMKELQLQREDDTRAMVRILFISRDGD